MIITDSTLRDGSHAVSHKLTKEQIQIYCEAIDKTNVHIVEVGHGNGLGASSILIGESLLSDKEMLTIARKYLRNSKLGVLSIPGIATTKNISLAIDYGVDVFRIASHCTEADLTKKHIKYCLDNNKIVYGVLMMSHMVDAFTLLQEAKKMQDYGAGAVILMDSAGNYMPKDVETKVSLLTANLKIPIGFHAHNNINMAIANSLVAVQHGAELLDGCASGFGAGAGNASIEVLIAALEKMGIATDINLYSLLDACDIAKKFIITEIIHTSTTSVISGIHGVCSTFLKPAIRISKEFNIDVRDVFVELGKRKVVAGQEDIIIDVVRELANKKEMNDGLTT